VTKVATIVGTRPQFVKAAAVSRVLRAAPAMTEILIHTGQHFDDNMSDVFFREMEIPAPNYNLEIGVGTQGEQTARMLEKAERVLLQERPDIVLLYGDTNSTLAGALAAAKLMIPIAHVEAGLRSNNKRMSEEINRIVADHLSILHFAPTDGAVANLLREGVPSQSIHKVGDVMYDAARHYAERIKAEDTVRLPPTLSSKGYVLATVHRAENTDDPASLRAIVDGLGLIASKLPVIFPIHPRTRGALEANGLLDRIKSTTIAVDPVSYFQMIHLEMNAALIVTDSGGVQKEAFFFDVPCVTVRDETEWSELIELGWNRLSPPLRGPAAIAETAAAMLNFAGPAAQPYGTGNAARAIVDVLATWNQLGS